MISQAYSNTASGTPSVSFNTKIISVLMTATAALGAIPAHAEYPQAIESNFIQRDSQLSSFSNELPIISAMQFSADSYDIEDLLVRAFELISSTQKPLSAIAEKAFQEDIWDMYIQA